jgi:hypothetical protein
MQLRNVVNHAKKQYNIMLNHTTLGTRYLVAAISLTDIFVVACCNTMSLPCFLYEEIYSVS